MLSNLKDRQPHFNRYNDHPKRWLENFEDCPVIIKQYEWEWRALLDIYNKTMPKNILEIGAYHGGSLWCWLKFGNPKKVAVIDYSQEIAEGFRECWEDWCKDIDYQFIFKDSTNKKTIQLVDDYFPDGIDWLFIDGDHHYEIVRQDFENYGKFVNKGGKIVFHDILPTIYEDNCTIELLWREIKQNGYVTQELYSSPRQDACGIGIVHV